MPNVPPFPPDQRSWRERERKDLRDRSRDRKAYVRPDRGNRPTDQRVRDRTAYARPDQGERPNYHSGGHKPRWLDEQTEIPEEEYKSYRTERRGRSQNDYTVFLPHHSPHCGMTTTFGDLCDFLCELLRHAPIVGERRRQCHREAASAPAVGGSSNSGAHQKKVISSNLIDSPLNHQTKNRSSVALAQLRQKFLC